MGMLIYGLSASGMKGFLMKKKRSRESSEFR